MGIRLTVFFFFFFFAVEVWLVVVVWQSRKYGAAESSNTPVAARRHRIKLWLHYLREFLLHASYLKLIVPVK